MKKPLIYLASPYSTPAPKNECAAVMLREQRFNMACRVAASLIAKGHAVISPIAHGHPICTEANLHAGWRQWSVVDELLLARSDEIAVLMLPGWNESKGVKSELKLARAKGKRVTYLEIVSEDPLELAWHDKAAKKA